MKDLEMENYEIKGKLTEARKCNPKLNPNSCKKYLPSKPLELQPLNS